MEIPTYHFAIREDLSDTGSLFLPTKGEELSSGYDVRAAFHDKKDLVLQPRQYFKIPLGFRAFCPEGWYYQLHPRSSSFVKKNLHTLIGIIDESWEGETLFAGQYLPDSDSILTIKFGEPIGQLIPTKKQEMQINLISNDDLNALYNNRGALRKDKGFGSTG